MTRPAVVVVDTNVFGADLLRRGAPLAKLYRPLLEGRAFVLSFQTVVRRVSDGRVVALAGRLIEDNLEVVDSYLPAFVAFCEGRLSAEEAVTVAED